MGKNYSADQLALHDRIVSRALAGKSTPDPHPKFIVLGGPMLTGKASTARLMMQNELGGTDFPPIDLKSTIFIRTSLFTELPIFKTHGNVTHPEKLPEAVQEYGDICTKICEAAKKRGLSIVWLDHAEDAVQTARAVRLMQGYKSYMCGFYVSPDWIEASLAMRQRDDGRKVDLGMLRNQQIAFSKNWKTFEGLFDCSTLFGFVVNTPPEKLVAADYKTICKCTKGGTRTILQPLIFPDFLRWAQLGPPAAAASR